MSYVKFNILAVTDKNGGISKEGKIPWKDNPRYATELNLFFRNTMSSSLLGEYSVVIMGRNTWELLDEAVKPLPNRMNIILTRNAQAMKARHQNIELLPLVYLKSSLDEALSFIAQKKNISNVWLIGGGQLFTEALNHQQLDGIYVSVLPEDFQCDKKLDFSNEHYRLVTSYTIDTGIHSSPIIRYQYYKDKEENIVGYLDTMRVPIN